jgi:hypothetical protein
VAFLIATACGGRSEAPIAEVDWDRTAPASGHVVDGSVELSSEGAPVSLPLTTIEAPAVGGVGYELVGEVRYRGVAQPGYLEMWSVFPDGGRYFSRTLASEGPLAAIQGDSGWRRFRLPFSLEGATGTPSRLELNLVLASAGTVWVGPVRLLPVGSDASGTWWSSRTAGALGAIAGCVLGIVGAAVGVLAARGHGRSWVLGTMWAMLTIGVVLLIASVVAAIDPQPWSVTGTLLLPGAILVTVVGSTYRNVRRSYAQAELRRIRALDAV